MTRTSVCVLGVLTLLVGGCGHHKNATRPQILSTYAPTPVQAPPLRQSQAIAVPTAPLNNRACPNCPPTAGVPAVPVVPTVPAQPGPYSGQVVPVPATPYGQPAGYGYAPAPAPPAGAVVPVPVAPATLGTPVFNNGFDSNALSPPGTAQAAPRPLFGRPLAPPPPPSTGF